MIVISRNLVLAEGDDSSADNGVILWDNLVTVSNIDAVSEDSAHPVTNLANPATHLYWVGAVTTGDEYLTVTTNTVEEIDGIGIAGHNFGTANITVSAESCEDLSESPQIWTEIIEEFVPRDDAPLLLRSDLESVAAVRVRLQPGDDLPRAAVLYVGPMLVLERSITVNTPHIPINMARKSKDVSGKSERGNFLGRILLNEYRESGADFEWFTPDWYRTNFDPFVEASKDVPFFYAWNPSEYPYEVGYVWMLGDPMPAVDPVTRRVAIELKYQGVA